jgi:hypothetical protein
MEGLPYDDGRERSPLGAYKVVLSNRVRGQLHDAPPILEGYLNGITAILRIDPIASSTMLHIRQTDEDAWTAAFGEGRGFITYWVVYEQRVVVVVDWIWAG